MAIWAQAVKVAASCWVYRAFAWRRVSAAWARATSLVTLAATWDCSRENPLKSVHDRPNRQEKVSGKLLNNGSWGESVPVRLLLYDRVTVGQYCPRVLHTWALARLACAAACRTRGAVWSTEARSVVVSGSGGNAESGAARTSWSTPIWRPR